MTALGSRSAAATAHGQIDGRSHPAYAEYRLSGVDWFQDVPAHWSVAPLYSRYEVQLGKMLDTSRITGRYLAPYLRNVDVQWDCVNSNDLPAMDFPPSVRERYRLARGDLLVCEGGEVGRTAIWQDELEECYYQKAVHRLRRRRPDEHPRFLFYVMQAAASQGAFRAGSSLNTIDHLTAEKLRRHRLPFAPSDEQRAVSEFLDRETENIDALVAKKQRLIELLQEKRTALISRAVTKGLDPDVPMKDSGIEWLGAIPAEWDAVPLGRIASSLQTGPFGSQLHSHEYIDDGTPVINPSNLRDGRVIPDWRCSVDEETAGRLNRHRVEAGDIVFGRRGEMGRCGLVRPAEEGWLCGTGCLRVKLQDELAVPAFFVLQLATNRVRDWLLLESVGSTMDNLNTSVVSRIPVAVPPVGTQHHIVSILAAHTAGLDTLATRVEAAIGCLGELRSALITAAVTGQVDVRAAL